MSSGFSFLEIGSVRASRTTFLLMENWLRLAGKTKGRDYGAQIPLKQKLHLKNIHKPQLISTSVPLCYALLLLRLAKPSRFGILKMYVNCSFSSPSVEGEECK